jgi:hypothetical protein
MARVCTGWRYALHRLAVKYLAVCIQTKRIDEQQLERWGWSSATLWDHNISTCSCILLAFDFFTGQQEKPVIVSGTSKKLLNYFSGSWYRYPFGIIGEKLFFAALDESGEKFTLKVINRLEPESEPRVLQGEITGGMWNANLVSCGDLLALLIPRKEIVSLWNGRDERWLADVDVASNHQLNRFDLIDIADIGVSSNLLGLLVRSIKLGNCLLFWRLETDQQAGMVPYFIGMVQIRYNSRTRIHINEKWVVIWLCGDQKQDIHYIDQSDLFTEDKSQIAASANVADSDEAGNKWRQLGVEGGVCRHVSLQPGHSSHVAMSTRVFRNRINRVTFRTGKKMSS